MAELTEETFLGASCGVGHPLPALAVVCLDPFFPRQSIPSFPDCSYCALWDITPSPSPPPHWDAAFNAKMA